MKRAAVVTWRRLRRREGGFTAIEVLLSMTLLAIGAAGVIGMERTAIKANVDSRRLDVANGIARLWAERLRRDATGWVFPNAENPTTPPTAVPLLFAAGTPPMRPPLNSEGAWHRPTAYLGLTNPMSPGFDLTGKDVTTMSDAFFCTNIRLNWLTPAISPASGTAPPGELIRAEIRVFWPRGLESAPDADYCTGAPDDTLLTPAKYHFVYVTTSIRRNTVSW